MLNQNPFGYQGTTTSPAGPVQPSFGSHLGGMMQSPMFGLAAGLLQGAMPGQTFGSGLNLGLRNAQMQQARLTNQQHTQAATTLAALQIKEMQDRRRAREAQMQARAKYAETLPEGPARLAFQAGVDLPQAAGPMSTIGKLAADLNAGRISQAQYDLATERMGAPQTVVNNMGQAAQRPLMLTDAEKSQYGYPQEANVMWGKEGPKLIKGMSSADAGKSAALNVAEQDVALVKSTYLNEDGTPNRGGIARSYVPFSPESAARVAQERNIETIVRMRSGADAKESEIQRQIDAFTPKLTDSDQVIMDKIDRLEDYISGARQGMNLKRKEDEPKKLYDVPPGFEVVPQP